MYLDRAVFYPCGFLAIVAVIVVLSRKNTGRKWLWAAAAIAALAFAARVYLSTTRVPRWGWDFQGFWLAGNCVWEHTNPYLIKHYRPPNDTINSFVNPPTSLPLFALFASGPERAAALAWTVLNVLMGLSLGLMARRALISQDRGAYPVVEPAFAALLTAPILLSAGTFFHMDGGQISHLVTLAILVALDAQARIPRRPLLSASGLAVATMKVTTMAPFLLLFLKRSDLRIWILMGILVLGLTLSAVPLAALPEEISSMHSAQKATREAGRINDYSALNYYAFNVIGIDVIFSNLGLGHGPVTDGLTLMALGVLAAWLYFWITFRPAVPRGACCAPVSLYSMLFVYHRVYDFSMLILPLVYGAGQFRASRGLCRWCYATAMAAIVLSINLPESLVKRVQALPDGHDWLKAAVLPYSTYLVLLAIATFGLAIHRHLATIQTDTCGQTSI